MRICRNILPIVFLSILSSCFSGLESDLERAIERDDRLVKDYLQRNNLEAIETALGYYFIKESVHEEAEQIENGDVLGVYYEISTLEGQLIERYFDESLPPRIFSHSEGGLVPRAMNFAAGLTREGEVINLFVPSYLAYRDYSYQQLITPNANLNIRVKYAKIFSEDELRTLEQEMILDYIGKNELEGFERDTEGFYLKIVDEGDSEGPSASAENAVFFTFELFQLGEEETISEITSQSNPFQFSLNREGNLKFLDLSLKGLNKGAELEVIAPSYLAFGMTTQVFPFQIRRDLFFQNYIPQVARPFEPVRMKMKIVHISG